MQSQADERKTLQQLVDFHTVDIWIGAVGVIINIFLLIIFFSKRSFFRQNMMLVVLAFGDLLSAMGILLVGISRRKLYLNILEHQITPKETAWTCSMKAFVWFRLLGSILQSSAVLWMGIERLLAVMTPVFYRDNLSKTKSWPCIILLLYASLVALFALFLAYSRRNQSAVYYCGRKAAFTSGFSTYVYATAIFGYVMALIMNLITLLTLIKMYTHRSNMSDTSRQLRILRYVVLISFFSTIAVIIPNVVSIFTAFYGRLDITISESGSWVLGIKCCINILIYFALKNDFRKRVFNMIGLNKTESMQMSADF